MPLACSVGHSGHLEGVPLAAASRGGVDRSGALGGSEVPLVRPLLRYPDGVGATGAWGVGHNSQLGCATGHGSQLSLDHATGPVVPAITARATPGRVTGRGLFGESLAHKCDELFVVEGAVLVTVQVE